MKSTACLAFPFLLWIGAASSPRLPAKASPVESHSSSRRQTPERSAPAPAGQQAQPGLGLSVEGNLTIPLRLFRARFGGSHCFRIWGPMRKDGISRFHHGGVIFGFLQPWPAGWYYTDAVFVESLKGHYFLCNPLHPGVFLAITVLSQE